MYIKQNCKRKTKAVKEWHTNLRRVFLLTLALSVLVAGFVIFGASGDDGYNIGFAPHYIEDYYNEDENGYHITSDEEGAAYSYESSYGYEYSNSYYNNYYNYTLDGHDYYINNAPTENNYVQGGYYNYEDCYVDYFAPLGGYIGITPFSPPIEWLTITNLTQLQALNGQIAASPQDGIPRIVRFNFPGGVLLTSAHPDIMPTINITGNRHIILDGNTAGVHQRWNRDGTTPNTGRHFNVTGGAALELRNVNISRPLGTNPTIMSGGINVIGNNSRLILNHANARISNNRTNHAGGGVFVNIGARMYMHNGSIDGNFSFVNYELVPPHHGDGGGVMVQENSFFEMHGGRVHNNESRVSGAGVFILRSEFRMIGGFIENNRATGDGGGLVINYSTGTMYNGAIRGNSADIRMLNNAPHNGWGGGVFIMGNNSNFTMHNGAIYQNRTYHGGGGVWVGGGTNMSFIMYGGIINSNRYRPTRIGASVPIPQGGGIWLNGTGCTVNLHGGLIQNNHAIQGGGVRASGGAELHMLAPIGAVQPVNIYNNSSTDYGGGVFLIGTNTVFNMRTGRIFRNTAFTAQAPPLGARGRGGGVYVDQATFNMFGGTIGSDNPLGPDRNMAAVGGGVYVRGGGSFNMLQGGTIQAPTSGTISGNFTSQYGYYYGGAGVLVRGAASGTNTTFNMQAGRITNNAFTHNRGGGVFLRAGAQMTMSGGSIDNNFSRLYQGSDAGDGGGVAVQDANTSFTMTGGTISDNTVGSGGGGILVAHHASFNIQNGNILRNTSAEGGGVWVVHQSTMNMHNGLIAGNTGLGGGINLANRSTLIMAGGIIEDNNGQNLGGGVFSSTGSTFTMSGTAAVRDNTAINGGGVAVYGGASPPAVPVFVPSTFTMTAGTIGNTNQTLGNSAVRGGGVHISGGAIANINAITATGAQILGNTATGTAAGDGGGGIFIDGATSQLNLTGGTIGHAAVASGNTAVRGGGLYMNIGTSLTINNANAHITGNSATGASEATDGGGGIFLTGLGTHLTLQNGTISGNRAIRGGGIRIHGGNATTANRARVTMSGGSIRNNRLSPAGAGTAAITEGGGVFASGNNTQFTMTGGTIGDTNATTGNQAVRGGGVFISDGTTFQMQATTAAGARIDGNTSTGGGVTDGGGGIYIAGTATQLTITGGTIGNSNADQGGNRAVRGGGIFMAVGTSLHLNSANAHILGNRATSSVVTGGGGGIFVTGGGTQLTLQNGTIDGNRAFRGGGVWIGAGAPGNNNQFTMTGGVIRNNRYNPTASGPVSDGGGVFVTGSSSQFTMSAGTIGNTNQTLGNRAASGGGVHIGGGATFNLQSSNATAAQILGNTGNASGGGVTVSGNNSVLNFSGGTIGNANVNQGNVAGTGAAAGSGGGIFVSSGTVNMTNANAIVRGNTAAGTGAAAGGGGVHLAYANAHLNLTNGIIEQNRAFRGGGVMMRAGTLANRSWVSMSGGYIRNNRLNPTGGRVTEGGGVHVTGLHTQFNMTGGSIGATTASGNHAVRGGGVYVTNGAWFELASGNIRGNEAEHGGGVFMSNPGSGAIASSVFTMSGGFIGGTATNQGNVATGVGDSSGGGVRIQHSLPRFYMTAGVIQNNSANRGAGIAAGGGTAAAASHLMQIYDEWIYDAPYEYGGYHYGLNDATYFHEYYYESSDAYNFYGYIGTAPSYIGIMPANIPTRPATPAHMLTIRGTAQILFNTAAAYGGGVHISSGAVFNMPSGTPMIANNLVTGMAASNGGGVHMTGSNTSFNMDAGVIQSNTALYGGGVSVFGVGFTNTTFTMTGGTIGNNSRSLGNTAQRGGGVWLLGAGASFTMQEGDNGSTGSIVGNEAIDMDGGTVSSRGGGGVFIDDWSVFTMRAGEIHYNHSTGGGAGVRADTNGSFTMYDGTITDNVTNVYGGGIFGNNLSSVTIHNGVISGNQALVGGGVKTSAIVNMLGGHIYDNTATSGGGGVSVITDTGNFTMSGGIIGGSTQAHANTAPNGGGTWVGDGASFNMQAGTVIIDAVEITTTGTIQGNEATGTSDTWPSIQGGGGLHVTGTGSQFNLYAGTVSDNSAAQGGGILVLDNANFNLWGIANKTITRNSATWGGGIFVSWRYCSATPDSSHMTMAAGADNVHITHNAAVQRGGGIFTMAAEYGSPLQRVSGTNTAYGNLTLNNVIFGGNTAGHREFSPVNALVVLGSSAWIANTLSIGIHPINNYDINHIGSRIELPLTGSRGTILFVMSGSLILFITILVIAFIVLKKRMPKVRAGGYASPARYSKKL